jgi:hypothetical protein
MKGLEDWTERTRTTAEKPCPLSLYFIFGQHARNFEKGGRAKETGQPVMLQTLNLRTPKNTAINKYYLRIGKCKQYIFQIIANYDTSYTNKCKTL